MFPMLLDYSYLPNLYLQKKRIWRDLAKLNLDTQMDSKKPRSGWKDPAMGALI